MDELEKSHVKQNLHDTVVYHQAIEMERVQMKESFDKGRFGGKIDNYYEFDEYYDEKYGK